MDHWSGLGIRGGAMLAVLLGAGLGGAPTAEAGCYCYYTCLDGRSGAGCVADGVACGTMASGHCGAGQVSTQDCGTPWDTSATGLICETSCGDGEQLVSITDSGVDCAADAVRYCGPSQALEVRALQDAPNLNCKADLSGDQVVNPSDLAALLGAWGVCTPECFGDIDCEDGNPCSLDLCLGGSCFQADLVSCCGNGVVDPGEECDPPDGITCGEDCQVLQGGSNCCISNGTPGCDNPDCEAQVCAMDPFCCDTSWDAICAGNAATLCPTLCSGEILLVIDINEPGACCLDGDCINEFSIIQCTQFGGSFSAGEGCHDGLCAVAANKCKVSQTGAFAAVGGCPAATCAGLPGAGTVWCGGDCPPEVCPAAGLAGTISAPCPGGGSCDAAGTSNGCTTCP